MKYAVIGLGSFGSALSRELATSGHEVLAIDTNENHIRDLREVVTMAALADGTEREALAQLGVAAVDVALITIGEGFEASLMITAHCQKLGVPRVYTRVINPVHEQLLDLMGVTGKIHVESLAAASFSRQITNEAVRRYFGVDANHAIVEIELPGDLIGKTLAEADFRKRHGLNVVTIRRRAGEGKGEEGYDVIGTPTPDFRLAEGDRLIVFGGLDDIGDFCGQG
jgi:trk system potassium uptake protein TrkA